MKPSVIAAFVASVIALAFAMRKRESVPAFALTDANKRYDIDEYIGDEQL
jgi:hypothetical protein